jgi:hypothetical protein
MRRLIVGMVGLVGLVAVLGRETQTFASVWDAANDFSASNNPNGTWSYGWSDTLGGTMALYDIAWKGPAGSPFVGMDLWSTSYHFPANSDPLVEHNGTGQDLLVGNLFQPANQLMSHPGPDHEYSIIRWLAPETTTISIQANFFGLDTTGTSTDVHVLYNNSSLFDGAVSGFGVGSGPSFWTAISVTAGDTVDFVVGDNGYYIHDTTGVNATIASPSVPEPATIIIWSLLGTLAISIGWWRRK